jgi:2-amino-4-hydroxy-6-hydroxymethyldihydropteridine diphosphokinase
MRVHLSLGSNLGDRNGHIHAAIKALNQSDRVRVQAVSPTYSTAPVGLTEQPDFLNLAVEIETDIEPLELLNAVQQIESALGRERTTRWGPRSIDIDIVLWGDRQVDCDRLTVPHPEFRRRAFVLRPLADIAPEAVDPVTGCTVSELAARPEAAGAVEQQF